MPDQSLATIKAALDAVDTATTEAATAAIAIQAKLDALHTQIANAPDLATAQALATQASAEVAKLTPLAAALTAMGQPDNPVPIPVPAPTPTPTPAP